MSLSTRTAPPKSRIDLPVNDLGQPMAFPATEAEFWAWLAECNYPAEFHRQHFIPMSYENRVHSQLAIWLGHLLIGLLSTSATSCSVMLCISQTLPTRM